MQIVNQVAQLRQLVRDWRRAGELVAFVPTMGNLHAGHLSLVQEAKARAQRVVVSIFVNPMQFAAHEDLDKYPRTEEQDAHYLRELGVDLLFLPPVAEIYPQGLDVMTRVQVPVVTTMLEGASRPGHFDGVSTVVTKLFNMVQPDVAVFGAKDYQQQLVIRKMVDDLNMPIEIVTAPTVRESSGLAMSSRNNYMNAEQRAHAATIYQVLKQCAQRLRAGGDVPEVTGWGAAQLEAAGFGVDYLMSRSRLDLGENPQHPQVLLVAVRYAGIRLIDNLEV